MNVKRKIIIAGLKTAVRGSARLYPAKQYQRGPRTGAVVIPRTCAPQLQSFKLKTATQAKQQLSLKTAIQGARV
jgi:hypothetical protein